MVSFDRMNIININHILSLDCIISNFVLIFYNSSLLNKVLLRYRVIHLRVACRVMDSFGASVKKYQDMLFSVQYLLNLNFLRLTHYQTPENHTTLQDMTLRFVSICVNCLSFPACEQTGSSQSFEVSMHLFYR